MVFSLDAGGVSPGKNTFGKVRPLAESSLLGPARAGLLADSWRQYGPAGSTGFTDKTDSAAFQLAVWEIINDGLPSTDAPAPPLAAGRGPRPEEEAVWAHLQKDRQCWCRFPFRISRKRDVAQQL